MRVRIVIPLLLVIVLSDLYIDIHYFYHHYRLRWWKRLLWWMPCLVVVVYTCCLASIDNFIPDNQLWLDVYLFLVGLAFGPEPFSTVVCSKDPSISRVIDIQKEYASIDGNDSNFPLTVLVVL